MIGQLRGKLIEKKPPHLMLDVNGVGYRLQAPLTTVFTLPSLGEEVILRTHYIVREDAQILYGFATEKECELFGEIIKINGVGPKVGLAILSGLTVQEFSEAVITQDMNKLQCLPGIGAKTAQRILVEMKDRLAKLNLESKTCAKTTQMQKEDPVQEALFALVALGFKQSEATKAIAQVDPTQGCEYIVKTALQGLAKV